MLLGAQTQAAPLWFLQTTLWSKIGFWVLENFKKMSPVLILVFNVSYLTKKTLKMSKAQMHTLESQSL